jgi:hypothetical protein
VHARYLASIQRRDSVQFFNENGSVVAEGTVHRIAGNVDPSTQSASVFCRVVPVAGQKNALRDGRFLTGEIVSEPIENAFEIPLTWMHNGNHVYEVTNGQLVEKSVQVLFQSRSHAIGRGLDSGAHILSESLTNAFDGMAVSTESNESQD